MLGCLFVVLTLTGAVSAFVYFGQEWWVVFALCCIADGLSAFARRKP